MIQKHFFDEIKYKSLELGFDVFGVTDLENFEFNSFKIKEFINNNFHGEMNWLKEKLEIRKDPKNIWTDAKSAIVLGINYGPEGNVLNDLKKINRGYISIYARRKDYHKVVIIVVRFLMKNIFMLCIVDVVIDIIFTVNHVNLTCQWIGNVLNELT